MYLFVNSSFLCPAPVASTSNRCVASRLVRCATVSRRVIPRSQQSASSDSDDSIGGATGSDDTELPSTPGGSVSSSGNDISLLRAPRDATPLRSESEIRRNRPAAKEPRRRRRRRGEGNQPVLEWDKMDSAPLVPGMDGWIDLGESAENQRKKDEKKQRLERSRNKVDDAMKSKLKSEVAQPYEQNWILWISVAVAVLAIAFKVTGGFDAIPIIPVPDL